MRTLFKGPGTPEGEIDPHPTDVRALTSPPADIEALFPEARRVRRHRRLAWLGVVLLLVAAVVGATLAATRGTTPHGSPTSPPPSSSRQPVGLRPLISPEHPYGLAVAPDGALDVLDTGRDQILQRLPSGKFAIFAGNGQRGFSGDGGPATGASLSIQPSSGIVVASNGSVYFSDTGNDRVREIAPNGTITTVAGGGTVPLTTGATGATTALAATFGQNAPAGLTIGPDGDLYIGAGAVYRLDPAGMLNWVVGEPGNIAPPPGWGGVYSNPAIQQDFSPAIRIAFDGRGDLLVAGGGGFGLYEKTAAGALRFIENFRGDGDWGSMATAPDGAIILSARDGLSTFGTSGSLTPLPADLSASLGQMTGPGSRTPTGSVLSNEFIGGDGVAVAPDGTIYVDTNTGSTFTTVDALIVVPPNGTSTHAVWKS